MMTNEFRQLASELMGCRLDEVDQEWAECGRQIRDEIETIAEFLGVVREASA